MQGVDVRSRVDAGLKGHEDLSVSNRNMEQDDDDDEDRVAEVTVKVYLSESFVEATEEPMERVESYLAVANEGFEASGVKVKLRLLCAEVMTGVGEDGRGGLEVLKRFAKYKGTAKRLLGKSISINFFMILTECFSGFFFKAAPTSRCCW